MSDELTLLRKLHFGSVTEAELMEIYHQYRDNYRVRVSLVMHPGFPQKMAFNIVPSLFPVDLMRVSKNKRANPFIRQKAELEFFNRYPRMPLGEKISLMKMASYSLMLQFIDEKDKRILEAMLNNPFCTEEFVMRLINRKTPRHAVYEALYDTDWYKRPTVAEAIANDTEAPIRMLITILPYLGRRALLKLYENEDTHDNVKRNIIHYYNRKQTGK